MPGQWITRDPGSGEIAMTYTDDEVSKRLRESNKESPAYDATAAERWFRIDRTTVGVAEAGGPLLAVYRWEFNLFEGIQPSARGFSLDMAEVARHMGLSIADYLAAPGSATSRARNEWEADHTAAVRAADALLYTLRQLDSAKRDWMTYDMRKFLNVDNTHELDAVGLLEPTAYARTKGALLAILKRLAHGDEGRAIQVYTDVCEHGRTIAHVVRAWEQRWFEEDYAAHVGRA